MGDDSILGSIKSMLGSDSSYDVYNADIMTFINASLAHLNDIGLGAEPLVITSGSETWDELTEDKFLKSMAKQFVYLDVKLNFDPPTTSFVLKSFEDLRKEVEWRIEVRTSAHH